MYTLIEDVVFVGEVNVKFCWDMKKSMEIERSEL